MKRALTCLALSSLLLAFSASAADKRIERLWKKSCASCHGMDGKADTEKGRKMKMYDMSTAKWQAKLSDAEVKRLIDEGVNEVVDGVKKEMDGYKKEIKGEDLEGILQYIRGLQQ